MNDCTIPTIDSIATITAQARESAALESQRLARRLRRSGGLSFLHMAKEALDSALLRLVAIVDSADAAIYSADLTGMITSWNRAAVLIFGYPAAEAIGHPIRIIIPPDRLNEEADLVELHGGTVHAASAGPGKGATLRVRLPIMIVHPEVVAEPHHHPARQTGGCSVATLEGVHVLAVDDDTDALTLVREIVEAAGARVSTVDSAAKALDQLEAAAPDVIVADIGLPLMDGFEFIGRIRQLADSRLRRTPAAALTAYARSEDRVRALRSGFQMHLAKPVDPAELVAAIAALAQRSRAG